MVIADTDVLIDFLAGRDPGAAAVSAVIATGALATTVITRFELLTGAKSRRQVAAISELLGVLPALGLDTAAADRAAQVRRALEDGGEPIGMADCLIAGIVLEAGGELLTRNHRHFSRVKGLRLTGLSATD